MPTAPLDRPVEYRKKATPLRPPPPRRAARMFARGGGVVDLVEDGGVYRLRVDGELLEERYLTEDEALFRLVVAAGWKRVR